LCVKYSRASASSEAKEAMEAENGAGCNKSIINSRILYSMAKPDRPGD